MFNSIYGIICEKLSDSIYLLAGGIEYDLSVPALDIGKLPEIGKDARVFTWLYHKETEMRLYGFASNERRNAFLELLKVDGIGPRAALRILGVIALEDLERALETEDLARLEAIPGLGKKTAQKLILTLKGKLVTGEAAIFTPYKDLLDALANMGYEKKAALNAINEAEKSISANLNEKEKEEQLFKQAIVILSSS